MSGHQMAPAEAKEIIRSFVRDYARFPDLWARAGVETREQLVTFLRGLATGHGVTQQLIDEIQGELTTLLELNAKPI